VATHDVIAIGASAGGVEAITAVVAALPRDLRASVLVVLHLARGRSVFPEILTRAGRLPAFHPKDGDLLSYGRIYVAPPDHHLTVEGDHVRVLRTAIENGLRPAVDPLFRSAARVYGPRVVGIVLTGSLDDGTSGLAAVKAMGGVTIVQDPDEAFAPSMPRSAMDFVNVDHILPVREIAPLLVNLTREQVQLPRIPTAPAVRRMEPDSGQPQLALTERDRPGHVSVFTCPECSGTLWEVDEEGVLRFRCRVGHVYSADSMLAAHTDSVDRALWAALRSLEERAALTQKMADRARARQQHFVARAFQERASTAADHAVIVRELLTQRTTAHVVPDHTVHEELAEAPPMVSENQPE
jgi:two-component system, chemotaxis family, protein-glutamate methylesterase/glutaminase